MTVLSTPHADAGVAFGAAVTVAALFVSLPRSLTWCAWIPLARYKAVPWRAAVLASTALAALGLWKPVVAALLLAGGVATLALATDLAPTDEALHAEEASFEAPLHPDP